MVFAFHGMDELAMAMRKIDKFDEGADQATYLVVYPRGVKFNLFTGWNVNLDARLATKFLGRKKLSHSVSKIVPMDVARPCRIGTWDRETGRGRSTMDILAYISR